MKAIDEIPVNMRAVGITMTPAALVIALWERGFLAALVRGCRWRVFCAVCLTAAVAAFSFEAASAQEGIDDSFIDLSVNLLPYNAGFSGNFLEAKNKGSAAAKNVRVKVLLQNQRISSQFGGFGARGTSYSSIKSNGKGDMEGTWEIGTLRAGESKTLQLATALDNTRDPGATVMLARSTAIISSDTREAAALEHDNEVTGFKLTGSRSDVHEGVLRDKNAAVMVSVDDQNPQPGDSVNFTLTVLNLNRLAIVGVNNSILDVEVPVRLAPGLEFAHGWTPNPSDGEFEKANSRSGTWEVGDMRFLKSSISARTVEIEAVLTTESLANIPLEERCISAWVSDMIPPPDPGYVLGRLTECLGDDPPVLFESGDLDVLTWYPCVGVSTSTTPYPCRNEDSDNSSIDYGLELVMSASVVDNPTLHAHGVGRFDRGQATSSPKVMLRPASVIIQVKDPEGRYTDGSSVSWQTAGGNVESGVQARFDWDVVYNAGGWSDAKVTVSATGVNEGTRPGSFSRRSTYCDEHDPDLTNCRPEVLNPLGPIPFGDNDGAYSSDVFYELGALGTYLVKHEAKGTHGSTEYTAGTSNFVIHVGPIAELSVRDGGPSLNVPAGQRAFTIVAVNRGPDDARAAEVTIKGLSANDVQSHNATKGSFNPNSGVWTIGELKTEDYMRSVSGRDGELLTIITNSSADKEIGVSIANTEDYQVCIDSSGNDVDAGNETACTGTTGNIWHTTVYYDYIDDNDSATVSQHEGTGTLLPTLQVSGLGGVAMLARWSELPTLYGRAVTHYEIAKSMDGGKSWSHPPVTVTGSVHVDLASRPGDNPTYRVRAVNGLFHKGPWSSRQGPGARSPTGTAQAPGVPLNVGAAADGGSAIDVFWDAPSDHGGAVITQYEVQWSADGTSGWRRAGYANDPQNRTYKHSGLSFGTTRYYRVAARNSGGRGAWSDPAAFATTRAGVPDAPTLTPHNSTPDTIRLRWAEPRDNGGAITRYELEWSEDGSVDSWESLDDNVQPPDREYEDFGAPLGAERYYRVRAVNEAGTGRWSSAARAVTPPGWPTVFQAESNGPNAILITWSPPDDDTDGSTVTRYELEVSTDGGDNYTRLSSPGSAARSYNHTGLRPGDTRHYQMRACNGAGCGHWSFPDYATVVAGVPYAPRLTAQANSASEIRLSWNKPNDNGSAITVYELEHYTDGSDWTYLDDNIPPDVTEYVHQDTYGDLFGGGTTHRYRVRALNATGDGAWSAEWSITISAQAPGKPELSFGTPTDDSITLMWPTPADNGSRITGYSVERNDRIQGYDNWVRLGTTGGPVNTYTDRNLYSGEYYCYRVVANSSVGSGPYSDEECEFTTGQYAIDPDPPIVRLSSVSPNRVTIAWDPPADDGGRPVTKYVYETITPLAEEFDGDCDYAIWDSDLWPTDPEKCFIKSANDRTLTFSNLEPGASYKVRVRTETSYSNGDWATVTMHLPAASDSSETVGATEDLQVKVSSSSLTVNEGRGEVRYTVTLNKAPQVDETVDLYWYMEGPAEIYLSYPDDASFVFDRENWNSGFTFTMSVEEDRNSDNEIALMVHSIRVGGREVSGPYVRVEVRDND